MFCGLVYRAGVQLRLQQLPVRMFSQRALLALRCVIMLFALSLLGGCSEQFVRLNIPYAQLTGWCVDSRASASARYTEVGVMASCPGTRRPSRHDLFDRAICRPGNTSVVVF